MRVAPGAVGGSALRLDAIDAAGSPAVSVDTLAFRPVDPAQLVVARRSGNDALLGHAEPGTV